MPTEPLDLIAAALRVMAPAYPRDPPPRFREHILKDMSTEWLLPVERFRQTLEIVRRESNHLAFSHTRLFQAPIGADWVAALDRNPELAERLDRRNTYAGCHLKQVDRL